MKNYIEDVIYVTVLIVAACAFGATEGCGGAVDDPQTFIDDDAGDAAPDAQFDCVCTTCEYPTPVACK